ncbi:MAG: DMT family transporter [Methanomassiliicoccales archaeon]
MNWFYLGIAALAGAAMAIQGSLNSVLTKNVGIWPSMLWVHVSGTLLVVILLVISKSHSSLLWQQPAPWPAYLGGILNVVIIWGVIKSIPITGVGNATTAIVLLQLITAVLIDNMGLLGLKKIGFCWWNLLGVLLMAAGARLMLIKAP